MNARQQRYAEDRLWQKFNERDNEISRKHTRYVKPKTNKEKLEAIRTGGVNLKKSATATTPLFEAYDFRAFRGTWQQDDNAIHKEKTALEAKRQSIQDQLILGDCKQAMELINNF